MILIDAIFINNSGGKVLLDYLINSIEKKNINACYLLDSRIKENHPKIKSNERFYIKASIYKRHQFYLRNKDRFTSVLCFGNLAPTIRIQVNVYTYFHQRLFVDLPKGLSAYELIFFKLKSVLFKRTMNNSDFWIVQTRTMKEALLEFRKSYNYDCIKIIPFYPPLTKLNIITRQPNTFLYVSSGADHKNHLRLIEAFKLFYQENKVGQLDLTISDRFQSLCSYVKKLFEQGFPIINHGEVKRAYISELYSKSEYLIYPSLSESFGLALVEAIECGCKILGADLQYLYEVCEPSVIFNPLDVNSIKEAMSYSVNHEIPKSKCKINNQINELIQLITCSHN